MWGLSSLGSTKRLKELEETCVTPFNGSWRKIWETIPRYTSYVHVDNQTIQNTLADHSNGIVFTESFVCYCDESIKNCLLVVDSTYLSVLKKSWKPQVRKRRRKGEAIECNEIDTENQFRKKVLGAHLVELYYNLLDGDGFEHNMYIIERGTRTEESVAGATDQWEFYCAM